MSRARCVSASSHACHWLGFRQVPCTCSSTPDGAQGSVHARVGHRSCVPKAVGHRGVPRGPCSPSALSGRSTYERIRPISRDRRVADGPQGREELSREEVVMDRIEDQILLEINDPVCVQLVQDVRETSVRLDGYPATVPVEAHDGHAEQRLHECVPISVSKPSL